MQKKNKAFTLTELLVVVIVIGILAAVVLPKFNKVIETRKTTEAEELMAAVRTEQEKRCALDKNYLTDLDKLSEIIPASDTKNFTYVATATGIQAKSKGKYGYTLQMPSYRDGRLCCESAEECAKLNKDYPLCTELTASGDYQSGIECAGGQAGGVSRECTGAKPASSQACSNGCGTQTRSVSCNTSTGQWETGVWTGDCTCSCTETQPESEQSCNGCGVQYRTITCDTSTGKWISGDWGSCSKTAEDCEEKTYHYKCSWKLVECYDKFPTPKENMEYLKNKWVSFYDLYHYVTAWGPGPDLNTCGSLEEYAAQAQASADKNAAGIEDEMPTHYCLYYAPDGKATVTAKMGCIEELYCNRVKD